MSPTSRLHIRQLTEHTPVTPEQIDAFMDAHTFPIVEGPSVTFVYRGEADAVFLQHWIFGLPSRQPFERLPDTDLWYLVETVPENSRIEYKYEIVKGEKRELIEDPLNPMRAHDPFGANSVCHGAGYVVPEWTHPDPEARKGTLESRMVPSQHLDGERRVTLYIPARFRRTHRYPLLIVHDGADFVRYSNINIVLDNLIHRLEIPPMLVALVDPGDRIPEYAVNRAHARFITEEILPWLEADYPLIGRPSGRCLLGASLGAVASFSTAFWYPEVYGRLMVMSGSFAFTDIGPNPRGPTFEPIVDFVNAYRDDPLHITDRMFMACGTYESLIYENRSLVPILQSTGIDLRYVEARDGHNWENWRDRLREGLSWLFPGPLWMIYE